jgi:hypothetical protein
MALLAIAVVVLAAITGLAGRPSAARSAAAPPAASTLAPEARQHPVGHADHTALPSLRVSSMRQADLRLDLPRLPWLVAFGATALALLAAAGPAWNVRPAVVRLPPTTSRTTRQVRGPPQPV